MESRNPKMSLCAQFDDLCRNIKVVSTGSEEAFKTFVESQLNSHKRLKEAENEIKKLKKDISALKSDKDLMSTQIKHLKSLIEKEINKRLRIEEEKNSMERQIALVREVLFTDRNAMDDQTKEKLAFLNSVSYKHNIGSPTRLETIEESIGSLLSLSDIDKTDEDLDMDPIPSDRRHRRSKGKRTIPQNDTVPKRKKSEEREKDDFSRNQKYQTKELNFQGPNISSKSERCNSDPTTNFSEMPMPTPPRLFHRSESEQLEALQEFNKRRSGGGLFTGTPMGTRLSSGGKLNRSHTFSSKTIIRPENCFPCGLRIHFCKQALKCQDCRVTCHPECKDLCPLPCIPTKHTPTHKGIVGTITDYVSTSSPMIPALIVHCVNEIESRGFTEVGLYRISGSEREVKELKDKLLRGRNLPSLTQVDIHAVCGTVKEFLRSLREPLIPRMSWKLFVKAAENPDVEESLNMLYNIIGDLPQPNRDTLSYMTLHLKRIAESPGCKMPAENLAKIFGPTIVGYSVAEPSDTNMLSETKHQFKVMHRLLAIPNEFWQNLMDYDPEVFNTFPKTPEKIPAPPEGNFRATLPHNEYRSKGTVTLGKTTLTPRNTRNNSYKAGKRPIFSSPHVK